MFMFVFLLGLIIPAFFLKNSINSIAGDNRKIIANNSGPQDTGHAESPNHKLIVKTSANTSVDYKVEFYPSRTGNLMAKATIDSYEKLDGTKSITKELYDAEISCEGIYDSIDLSNKHYQGFPRVTD